MYHAEKSIHSLQGPSMELAEADLLAVNGAGEGPWEVGGSLGAGSRRQPCGSIDLSYHAPRGTVTGTLSTQGRGLETGIGYQGKVGAGGRIEGTFNTNGHDWSTTLSYRQRF